MNKNKPSYEVIATFNEYSVARSGPEYVVETRQLGFIPAILFSGDLRDCLQYIEDRIDPQTYPQGSSRLVGPDYVAGVGKQVP